jgi:predicted Fe-Mo cluster-binding NifX family protein
MKIAIPVFGTRVSPCFEYAPYILVATVERNSVLDIQNILFTAGDPIKQVVFFIKMGVDKIICGGISNFSQQLLVRNGITVLPGVTGEADDALKLYLQLKFSPL